MKELTLYQLQQSISIIEQSLIDLKAKYHEDKKRLTKQLNERQELLTNHIELMMNETKVDIEQGGWLVKDLQQLMDESK